MYIHQFFCYKILQFGSQQVYEDVTNKYKIHFLNSPAFTNDYKTYRCTKTSQRRCETFWQNFESEIYFLCAISFFFKWPTICNFVLIPSMKFKCLIFYTVGLTLEVSRAHGRAVMKQQFTDDHFRWVGHTIIEWAQPFQILVIGTCSQIQQSLEAWNWNKM